MGIQVGTAFALCEESGILEEYKQRLLQQAKAGTARVFTDPVASPTGFPFKVARLEGTVSEPEVYFARKRICDVGYLREAYRRPSGGVGFRCPGEPVESCVVKGGAEKDTIRRKCLCSALVEVAQFLREGRSTYSARGVIERLLAS